MTLAQKKTFLSDICYVMGHASAYHDYTSRGFRNLLLGHPFETTIHDALLESSLAFLRKINEFFGKNSDASARAFIPDYPLAWLWSKEDCTLLNDRVMHLSLCEALEGKFDWMEFLDTHLPEARKRFNAFIDRLRHEQPELFEQKS